MLALPVWGDLAKVAPIPLADCTALVLLTALAEDENSSCAASAEFVTGSVDCNPRQAFSRHWQDALDADPLLLFWAGCCRFAQQQSAIPPLGEAPQPLARWLAEHFLSLLSDDPCDGRNSGHFSGENQPSAKFWADWFHAAWAAAFLADQLTQIAITRQAESTASPEDGESQLSMRVLARQEAVLRLATEWAWPPGWTALDSLRSAAWDAADANPRSKLILELAQASLALVLRNFVDWPDYLNTTPARVRRLARRAYRIWQEPVPATQLLWEQVLAHLQAARQLRLHFAERLQTEKLHALAEFAAGAGHEINNPLAVISGRAQLYMREEHDPERRRDLALIQTQAARIHEMIADLMLFARPPQPVVQAVPLAPLISQLLAQIAGQAQLRQISLDFNPRSGEPQELWAIVDPLQFQQALKAVVVNSLEAIGSRGRVQLRMFRGPSQMPPAIHVEVCDTGPGIAPEVRRHLFDPYFSGRQAGRGLGNGLAKCWQILTSQGGRVEVSEPPQGGTVFTLVVPAAEQPSTEGPVATRVAEQEQKP